MQCTWNYNFRIEAYLAYRRGYDKKPISTIYVLNKRDDNGEQHKYDDDNDPNDLELLQDPVYNDQDTGILIRLAYKR